ncbi:GmrSD restriction endonuclease domain-containing protein [Ponticaulis profundi]|uniref:DUF262 domain-containing protein n=1 Tax=Ponticaulis profundi TaxID=2665222 RepID=A0ABW1SDN6_9PROT
MSTFDSTKASLPDLIREITEGKLQLPDFQRGWVWDDDHIRSLLVSIARSFPVGAVMLLETGGDVRFQVRPVENVTLANSKTEPERLILDGQQRLTSLTQTLALDKPVNTTDAKKKAIKRYYYIDIELALQDDRLDESIIAVDEDRMIKSDFGRKIDLDLSTPENECKAFYFPCNQILNSDAWEESLQEHNPDRFGDYMKFRRQVLNAYRNYQVPVIELKKATSKEAVCLVFEKVNTGGVPLSVFELVTASFAADNFNLRDDWYGSDLRKVEGRVKRVHQEAILSTVEPTDFLQAISLLKTYEKRSTDLLEGKRGKLATAVSAKRATVLTLDLDDYKEWADKVEQGFIQAAKFMRRERFFSSDELPYRTQLVPIAAVMVLLGNRWMEPKIFEKLSKWFWCGVFGELYGGAVETRIANDLEELMIWIGLGEADPTEEQKTDLPRTIIDASFQPSRLDTLRTRNSAAYKGLNVLVLRQGAKDFFWKGTVDELEKDGIALDIHHIFPRDWCEKAGYPPSVYNAVVNKTPISFKVNRMIGAKAPSQYLNQIQNHEQVGLSDDGMDEILAGHFIDPATMRADDFDAFYKARRRALLKLVEGVMDKAAETEDDDLETSET